MLESIKGAWRALLPEERFGWQVAIVVSAAVGAFVAFIINSVAQ